MVESPPLCLKNNLVRTVAFFSAMAYLWSEINKVIQVSEVTEGIVSIDETNHLFVGTQDLCVQSNKTGPNITISVWMIS
jgi:hypothetical protein